MCSGASVEKEEKPRSSVIPRSCRTWCFEDSMPRASRSWWLRLSPLGYHTPICIRVAFGAAGEVPDSA
ncbi:unnamed protein product [Cladocopium goreaui]|uniref:Uncharacterized protein n=1 Tax=Cladocopium goreaui TaxID=2562237 RepID=A0A9P1CWQ0_9DINO|nr:unnamed protein product [Cladocopium goreaui]